MKVNLTVQDGSQNAYRKIIVEWQKKKNNNTERLAN